MKGETTVFMTRTADERLADSQVEDLRERVGMINEIQPMLTVSIHQNSYSDENVKGSQSTWRRLLNEPYIAYKTVFF